jgi:protein ImuB
VRWHGSLNLHSPTKSRPGYYTERGNAVRESATNQRAGKEYEKSVRAIIALLHKWGIHTFGDFTRLGKEQIRARLGANAVRLWERAHGQSMRLLKFVQPPETFNEHFEFEYEVETAEPLLFILRRFLEQLALRLTGIYLVTKQLTLRIQFSNQQTYERSFQIPAPTNDVHLLFRMLQTHLEDFKSEHAIVGVSLEAEPVNPLPQQFGLFETSLRNPNQLYETLARLTALLGPERVGTPVLEETHRPDAFHIEPFVWELNETKVASEVAAGAALRRFRPARPASVFIQANQPVEVSSREVNGTITRKSGPYAASGNWWDEKTWSRSEWDAEMETGAIYRFHCDGEHWALDGLYD